MEDKIKLSISGIRGIIGSHFNSSTALNFALAYGTFVLNKSKNSSSSSPSLSTAYSKAKIKIALGYDGRQSGIMLKDVMRGALASIGIDVLDLGLVPTPTVLFTVKDKSLDGGIIITASHNDYDWNGIKFANEKGQFINKKDFDSVLSNYEQKDFTFTSYNGLGKIDLCAKAARNHINRILKFKDIERIKRRRFKVVLDPVNGAGSIVMKSLLEGFNCKTFCINDDTKSFSYARSPEPIPSNITKLEDTVKNMSYDLGIALDPDCDRLSLVSEEGVAIGEEYTLAIAINHYLKVFGKTSIGTNISTSRMIDDIARSHKTKVYRSAVGEINVLEKMQEKSCEIGGEGNGGVIIPKINSCRDALVSALMILDHLALENKPLSEIVKSLANKQYHFLKDKISLKKRYSKEELSFLYQKINNLYKEEADNISFLDGIRIDFSKYWFQIRESNTEPILRIFIETSIGKDFARDTLTKIKNNTKLLIKKL